eukprot:211128-Chlamydomonas_euryale.AAC.10
MTPQASPSPQLACRFARAEPPGTLAQSGHQAEDGRASDREAGGEGGAVAAAAAPAFPATFAATIEQLPPAKRPCNTCNRGGSALDRLSGTRREAEHTSKQPGHEEGRLHC